MRGILLLFPEAGNGMGCWLFKLWLDNMVFFFSDYGTVLIRLRYHKCQKYATSNPKVKPDNKSNL